MHLVWVLGAGCGCVARYVSYQVLKYVVLHGCFLLSSFVSCLLGLPDRRVASGLRGREERSGQWTKKKAGGDGVTSEVERHIWWQ